MDTFRAFHIPNLPLLAVPVSFDCGDDAFMRDMLLTIYEIMKADILDIPLLKMLLAQIGSGAAAENIIGHNHLPFEQHSFSDASPRLLTVYSLPEANASFWRFSSVYKMKNRP